MRRLLNKIPNVGDALSGRRDDNYPPPPPAPEPRKFPPPVPPRMSPQALSTFQNRNTGQPQPCAPPAVPPRPPLETLAELYAYWSGSGYELINNLWGRDAATSGSQTTFVDAVSPRGDGVQWHTTWTWTGAPDRVKSYPYAGRQIERGRTISSVRSMPTSVEWAYDVENVKANVAYDLFTARDKDHVNSSGDFELMIWLARYDVYPIGSSVQCVNICGIMWDLWIGFNGEMKVYSFVPMPGVTIRSFRGDVREFFGFLERFDRFPAQDQHLIVFQVGTECFTGGPATFTCNHFSADVI